MTKKSVSKTLKCLLATTIAAATYYGTFTNHSLGKHVDDADIKTGISGGICFGVETTIDRNAEFYGIVISFRNHNYGKIHGISLGLGTDNKGTINGYNIGLVGNYNSGTVNGLALSALGNVNEGRVNGVQLSGLANMNGKNHNGVSVAILGTENTGNMNGFSLSAFNIAHQESSYKGVQFGIYNRAATPKNSPINGFIADWNFSSDKTIEAKVRE